MSLLYTNVLNYLYWYYFWKHFELDTGKSLLIAAWLEQLELIVLLC